MVRQVRTPKGLKVTFKHPHPGARGYPETVSSNLRIEIVDDDVITVARIFNEDGHAIAAGVAKRHRKDKRNNDLGRALALSRAYKNLSLEYDAIVDRLTTAPVQNVTEEKAVKAARAQARAAAKARKDQRRAAAREAYEAKTSGWEQRVFDGRDAAV